MADDLAALRARIQTLEDREAIRACIVRAARGLDRHDADTLRSAFHDDAVVNISDFVGDREAFLRWSRAGHEALYGGHTHNITCQTIDLECDTAHAESYVVMVLRHKDGKTVTIAGGRYIDRLERRGSEWRIVLRRLAPDWRITADGSAWAPGRAGIPYGTWERDDLSYQRPLTLPPELQAKLDAGKRGG